MKTLGNTGIVASELGLGTAFLGVSTPGLAARQYRKTGQFDVDWELGVQTILEAMRLGITLIDTAPLYLGGEAEKMIAEAQQRQPGWIGLVTTKIGRLNVADALTHSYLEARHSFQASLKRLNVSHLPLVYLHDPMGLDMEKVLGKDGAFRFLLDLKHERVIQHIGLGANDPETCADYLETGLFEVAVVPNAWSLINQTALERIFPAAVKNGVGLVVANAVERGLLATGPVAGREYLDRRFSPECLAQVTKMERLCQEFDVSLLAVALKWCLRHPSVDSVLVGARTPEEIRQNVEAMNETVPDDLWSRLEPLVKTWDVRV